MGFFAGKTSVKINAAGDNLAIYNAFKEIVTGADVLDGDLRLNDGTLEKINFGGKARRFIDKNADSISSEEENCAVRQALFDSAQAHIERCGASREAKDAMLALLKDELTSDSFKNVPLSRRTVRMIVDAIDVMAGQKADQTKAADSLTISGRFGDFTLTKTQYTAMFKQTLIQLEKDPNVSKEQLSAYENLVDSYLAAFAKKGSLGNLGVFFMGSMDMKSVIDKMTGFFNKGVLPPRVGKGKATVNVLSPDMVAELNNLRVLRMTKGDNALANKVDITRLHPANAADFQALDQKQGVRPQMELIKPAELPPAAKLVADLIFNDNLLEMQECQFNDGERIIQTLSKDFSAFKQLCQDVKDFDGSAGEKTLATLRGKSDFFKYLDHVCKFKDVNDELVQGILELVRMVDKKISGDKPFDPNVNRGALYAHYEALYDIARDLGIEKKIDEALRKSVTNVSTAIATTLGASVKKCLADNSSEKTDEMNSSEKAIKELETNNDRLLGEVLPNYFERANSISLRRMFASALRQSTMPIDSQIDNDKGGGHIDYGAFLMGSGPYMLKLLQGLDIGKQIVNADGDTTLDQKQIFSGANRIKSQMPGLDVDTIYAHLLAIGGTNESMFKSVELQRELGAASVGVTYACKVTLGDGEKKDVVLKMLRPGIEEQIDEEAKLMLVAGKDIGLGREVALTTESIKRELKLDQEFTALQKGREMYSNTKEFISEYETDNEQKVYSKHDDQVDSVKPVLRDGNEVAATKNCMIMERAPGVSVANYIGMINKEAENGFGLNELDSLKAVQDVVSAKRDQLEKLHSATLQVAAKLLDGLFPKDADKEGYFHGDLHAGNMMYDETSGKITLIDYGKGTWLKPAQSDAIRKLLAIASVERDVSEYTIAEAMVNVYEQIMQGEQKNNEAFKLEPKVRNQLLGEYVKIAEERLGNGIELLADFGRAAMKAGADLPLVFFDFFGTCGKLGSEIHQIEKAMTDLDTAYAGNAHFCQARQAMAQDLSEAFNDSLFYVNGQDNGFDNNSIVGKAISVMTGCLDKVELPGLSTTLENRTVSAFDFGRDGNLVSLEELKPPSKNDKERHFVYQESFGSDKFEFAKNEMKGMLESVAKFNEKMSDSDVIGYGDMDSMRVLVDRLKGSAAAFRKIIASQTVKVSKEEETDALKDIAAEYDTAYKKLGNIDKKIGILNENANALNAIARDINNLKRADWPAYFDKNKSSLVTVLKCAVMYGGTPGMGEILDIDDLRKCNEDGEKGADTNFREYIDSGKMEDACRKYGETKKVFWQTLTSNLCQEFKEQKGKWEQLKNALAGNMTLNSQENGFNGKLIKAARELMMTPETVVENGLLKKIDDVVSRFDALYYTMKSDFSVGRIDYRGDVDTTLGRNFHLYSNMKGLGLKPDEQNVEIAQSLYSDEIGSDGQISMTKALSETEHREYTKLFNLLRQRFDKDALKAEGCPDPDDKKQLTRQDLSNLHRFAGLLKGAASSSDDPVTAMMQGRIGMLFAGDIGKDSDSDLIKVITNRIDKINKAKLGGNQNELLAGFKDFAADCAYLKFYRKADNESVDKLVNRLSELKKQGDGDGIVDLEIAQIKQEAKSEINFLIGRVVNELNAPSDVEDSKPGIDVDKMIDKMTEKIRSDLKNDLGEASLEKVKEAGLPEELLVCAFLRGRGDDGLANMVKALNVEEKNS